MTEKIKNQKRNDTMLLKFSIANQFLYKLRQEILNYQKDVEQKH